MVETVNCLDAGDVQNFVHCSSCIFHESLKYGYQNRHVFINIFWRIHFSALKSAREYEKNMSYYKNLQKLKKVEWTHLKWYYITLVNKTFIIIVHNTMPNKHYLLELNSHLTINNRIFSKICASNQLLY